MEIDNSAGNVQIVAGSNLFVQDELILTNGKLDLNSNKLTLGSSGNNGVLTADSHYVISQNSSSQFIRYSTMGAPTAYLFPLGDAGGYTPITVNLDNSTFVTVNSQLVASMNVAAHPNLGSSTNYLTRYWSVNPINLAGTPSYAVSYIYKDADVVGVEANLKPFKYGTSTGWIAANGSGAVVEMGIGSVNPGQ